MISASDPQSVTIISRKFDGSVSRSWKCGLTERSGDLLTFLGVFDRDIEHPDLGFIRRGTLSYEYYWLDRWYNIFRFHEPDGALRNYYCNINMPPRFDNDVLDYVDLDIDVLVSHDLSYRILDLEEFEANALRFGYSEEIREKVSSSVNEVVGMIERLDFPFDQRGWIRIT